MGFKTAEPATRAPTRYKPPGGFSLIESTRTPTIRSLATIAPSPPTKVKTPAIGSGVVVEPLLTTLLLISEQSLQREFVAIANYALTQETLVSTFENSTAPPSFQETSATLTQESIVSLQAPTKLYSFDLKSEAKQRQEHQPTYKLTEEGVVASSQTTVGTGIVASVLADGITLTTAGTGAATAHETTASVAPAAGALLVLAFVTGFASAKSVTGLGCTWVQMAASPAAGTSAVEVWRTQSSSPGSGLVTINFSALQTDVRYSLMSFTGVSTASTEGAGAIVQIQSTVSTVFDALGATVRMNAPAAARNLMVGVLGQTESSVHVPGPNFTVLSDIGHTGGGRRLHTQYGASTSTAVSWTWSTGSSFRAIAFEVG